MLKSKIYNVIWIILVWTMISVYQFLISYSVIFQFNLSLDDEIIIIGIKGTIITGLLAGVIGGIIIVFVWEKWLRTKPYGWTLKRIFVLYTLLFYFISYVNGLFFKISHEQRFLHDENLWFDALLLPFEINVLVPYVLWLSVVILTLITFIINDKYGPGIFWKFLLGRYNSPKKEERIFMFLDLRSSTVIAEELGEQNYFNFIKDVYKESTPGILNNHGEIYQYVGDEVVVSWPVSSGSENNNCLNCYFEIKQNLLSKREFFLETYGIFPEFKAGLHYGYVMAGEIGVVKRDIVYSGDVLNTTSRIQGKCNELKTDLLISKSLLQQLKPEKMHLAPLRMGEIDLRGKKEKVEVFTF